jgi:hypothetical protein
MALIDTIRAVQYSRQLSAAQPSSQPQAAEYLGRDPITGNRQLVTADGSVIPVAWAGATEPPTYPIGYRPPNLSRPGEINA